MSAAVEIIELEKVCRSQAVSIAAARGMMSLIESGFSRYGHSWDLPAIAAMIDGNACVGVLLIKHDEAENSANVSLAWCESGCQQTLAALLLRLRSWCGQRGIREVYFTAHTNNDTMRKAAAAVGATPWSQTFRVDL